MTPDAQVFEHARVGFSLLAMQARAFTPVEVVKFETVSLRCALSGERLVDPVRVTGVGPAAPCGREAALAAGFTNFSSDTTLARLLLVAAPFCDDITTVTASEALQRSAPSMALQWPVVLRSVREFGILGMTGALDLRNATPPRLTRDPEGRLCVFVGRGKDAERSITLMSPLLHNPLTVDPQELATQHAVAGVIADGTEESEQRSPLEAIAVCLGGAPSFSVF